MNTLKFKLLAISLLVLGISLGQESLFNAQNIISPEINQDHTVVFRVFAPNAASVKLTGDFLPTEKSNNTLWRNGCPYTSGFN
jgi:1,4-alpha-glucan branching enzyme